MYQTNISDFYLKDKLYFFNYIKLLIHFNYITHVQILLNKILLI